ncbi:PLD nuclease N-terminal domain-containing protein [Paenibacillus sp. HJGM_3]|uniref:PLD nuclease N-terminal domain-containing protein n=1 Tax=Paenibacillus sp. HJGM_3 TaxID=3379816 RepID=UPI00385E1D3B
MTNLIEQINWAIVAPLLVVQLILVVIALTDCIRAERTNGPKWLWAIVIVVVNLIGPVLYFVFGRSRER